MATVTLGTTKFTLAILPSKDKYWAKIALGVENEQLSYYDEREELSYGEVSELVAGVSRLLAGGYDRVYTLKFDRAGFFVDLYPYSEAGSPLSRRILREKDCIAAIGMLFRSKDKKSFLDGVFTLLLHRSELSKLAEKLREEYEKNCIHHVHGRGEYVFAGVSPLGYRGCRYWYFDPTSKVKRGDYVWVRMGRRNTEQIVYVDEVRKFDIESAPYNPENVKQVLRKATQEELAEIEE